jgi:hypothetical protein
MDMGEHETLGSFAKSNKSLLKKYLQTRLEIFKLSSIRVVSKIMGYLVWLLISTILFFLIAIFAGLTLGFWLSKLLSSYTLGFGIVLICMLALFGLLAMFRKILFVNPFIKMIIARIAKELDIVKKEHLDK